MYYFNFLMWYVTSKTKEPWKRPKNFWPFGHFRIEGQKLGPFLIIKYIKNQSYQNMSIILKVGLLYILQWKKSKGFCQFFDIEKWLWKSELWCFRPSIPKQWKGQKYVYGRFHSSMVLVKKGCVIINQLFRMVSIRIKSLYYFFSCHSN